MWEKSFDTKIVDVFVNKKILIIVFTENIMIYDIEALKLLQCIDNIGNKLNIPVCALTIYHSPYCYLALPATSLVGDILIYDALSLTPIKTINAHREVIQQMEFSKQPRTNNFSCSLLATASKKGTIIRIFSIPFGQKMFIFRRGSFPATIHSLSFSQRAEYIVYFTFFSIF